MYKKSIKENTRFLTPCLEGIKYYGSDEIVHGISTMIILNSDGDVLTCKHVAEKFLFNAYLKKKYGNLFCEVANAKSDKEIKNIEKKYKLKKDSVIASDIKLLINIYDNDGKCNFDIIMHKYLDVAVIRFKTAQIDIDIYPVFSKLLPEQGQSVCKLGYAFPEYNIFEYSKKENAIVIKENAYYNFPVFPIDGMVTRLVGDEKGKLTMFETSTPGFRGQSGGPIFGPDGIIYGIQSITAHLDLDFDVDKYVKRGMEEKKVHFTPFINLGIGVSSMEIIKFLEENNIKFKSK